VPVHAVRQLLLSDKGNDACQGGLLDVQRWGVQCADGLWGLWQQAAEAQVWCLNAEAGLGVAELRHAARVCNVDSATPLVVDHVAGLEVPVQKALPEQQQQQQQQQ
jgi:hypothetical protein